MDMGILASSYYLLLLVTKAFPHCNVIEGVCLRTLYKWEFAFATDPDRYVS